MTKRTSTKLHVAASSEELLPNTTSNSNADAEIAVDSAMLTAAAASLTSTADELSVVRKALAAARHTLEVAESNLIEKQAQINHRSTKLAAQSVEIEAARAKQAETAQDNSRLRAELAASEDNLAAARSQLSVMEALLSEKQLHVAKQDTALAALAEELELLRRTEKARPNLISDHEPLWQRSLLKLFEHLKLSQEKVADACREVAKTHYQDDAGSTLVLASLAQALTKKAFLKKWFGFSLFKNGLVDDAAFVLDELNGRVEFSYSEQRAYQQIKALTAAGLRSKAQEIIVGADEDAARAPQVVTLAAPISHTKDNSHLELSRPLANLRVACIMDEFTFSSYAPEATFQALTPDNWEDELSAFAPELLFIESAWRGKDEKWGSKVGHFSQELQGILRWCRDHNIPTVFWNKEDPVHFETFLNTAAQFDYVFTTDVDCIGRYKAALGHDRVYLLPFACQPALHNPVETYERKDAFCFAGAYYVRYPDRTRDLESFVEELPKFRPLEIYDRNYGKNHPDYQFPESYQPYIVGTLPFDQIDKAYKGYNYAINLNSIKQSQSMFARRVFELLASNTITVSNFSRGLRLLFGDLVVTSDNGGEIVRRMKSIIADENQSRRLRLAGLRKVMREHTYGHRLAYVASKALGQSAGSSFPTIAVLARAENSAELSAIVAHYQRQTCSNTTLQVILSGGWAHTLPNADHRIKTLTEAEAAGQSVADLVPDADFVALMIPEDYYGPNYLLDLALSAQYSNSAMIGKGAHYCYNGGKVQLVNLEQAYRPTAQLALRSAVIRSSYLRHEAVAEWTRNARHRVIQIEAALSIDEFNYCQDGARGEIAAPGVTEHTDDLPDLNDGFCFEELLQRAEGTPASAPAQDEAPVIIGKRLAEAFPAPKNPNIIVRVDADSWQIESKLPDGAHDYIYSKVDYRPEDLGFDGKLKLYLETTPGLNLRWVVQFLDSAKKRISHVIFSANQNYECDLPAKTAWLRFGVRIFAAGTATIGSLVLGTRRPKAHDVICGAEHLLITNHYPSYQALYRNGFVHSRVLGYRDLGVAVDVFRLRPDEDLSFHEFGNVDCVTGTQDVLRRMLDSGRYKGVLVHFLDETTWDILKDYVDQVKVTVWVHGAEIQPFHRRDYNYDTDEKRSVAQGESERRLDFWRRLLKSIPENLHLVFVSRYFAEEVMEDLGFRLPETHYSVIHNPVATDLFGYKPKPAEQRKKILSIRSYASAKYANDLSVAAIKALTSYPWFSELEFRLIGDGRLFDETVAPLAGFDNVILEKRFLTQPEIAALQQDYGVFLCPTRWDSQGVSRDEAMASGLVPITNAVSAVPEFVDTNCGYLADAEDPLGLVQAIANLYENPHTFTLLSKKAAERVRRQSDAKIIVKKEISLVTRT
ncbi:glycosyltransferase [Microvirga sp. BT689]|uniref:glycosyltransferase family protein n=1 Tax=Microvirga arvi TaxID=2778731 RepID=UPI00194E1AB3|nr:glycosyltransferase [Microvirga arvi]MBM6583912.1 glycosyltransferase [Microvirga arvi]